MPALSILDKRIQNQLILRFIVIKNRKCNCFKRFFIDLFILLNQIRSNTLPVMQFFDSSWFNYYQYMQCMAYNSQISHITPYFNQYYSQVPYSNLEVKYQSINTQEAKTNSLQGTLMKLESQENNFGIKGQKHVVKFSKSQNSQSKALYKNKKIVQKSQVQKEGRNSNSNLLRMFFRTLENRTEALFTKLNKIIEKHSLSLKVEDFIVWLQKNKVDHKNYIRISSVKKVFVCNPKDAEYNLIMRILMNDFAKNNSISSYLTSKKIKKSSPQEMKCNYMVIRNIFKEIYCCPQDF